MLLMPKFEEIHIVSDLHMGGLPGFQILRETQRLAGYINWVADQSPDAEVALVLNGDVIDTLAEDVGGYVAFDNAVPVIQRIMGDDNFSPVWDALAALVAKPGRTLVVMIGNHDIELAFPPVQQAIVERLAGTDPVKRARIHFSTIGAGFTCMVGQARVFCTHGNEIDPWNFIRYEDLSKAARRLNANRSLARSDWEPNAGTKMVKDVMNEVKRRYRWIDLLKPEAEAAVGVLLALDPGQISKLKEIIPIAVKMEKDKREVDGRLSAEGFTSASSETVRQVSIEQLLGPSFRQGVMMAHGTADSADALLLATEERFQDRTLDAQADQTLGVGQYLWDRITGWITDVGEDEALRRALKDLLKDDTTFQLDNRDDTSKEALKSIGSGIDFVVTGHTHLERAIDTKRGTYYFNCGTWIRLLRFTDAMLADKASFKPVYDVLKNGSMEKIDNAVIKGEPFVIPYTSAVCIRKAGDKTIGELAHIGGAAAVTRTVVQSFTR